MTATSRMIRAYLVIALMPGLPTSLGGQQSLSQAIATVTTGTVHLSFAARPGVCGNGLNNISTRQEIAEWEADCEDQPVRLALQLEDHAVIGVRTYVGGHWRAGSCPGSGYGKGAGRRGLPSPACL
jgi:hypothetical protein